MAFCLQAGQGGAKDQQDSLSMAIAKGMWVLRGTTIDRHGGEQRESGQTGFSVAQRWREVLKGVVELGSAVQEQQESASDMPMEMHVGKKRVTRR